MVKRYELSNERWQCISDLVAAASKTTDRTHCDNRRILNGIFWVLCSGAEWEDLPKRYGDWSKVYSQFQHWHGDGTFNAILSRLQLKLRRDGYMDLDTWMNPSPL